MRLRRRLLNCMFCTPSRRTKQMLMRLQSNQRRFDGSKMPIYYGHALSDHADVRSPAAQQTKVALAITLSSASSCRVSKLYVAHIDNGRCGLNQGQCAQLTCRSICPKSNRAQYENATLHVAQCALPLSRVIPALHSVKQSFLRGSAHSKRSSESRSCVHLLG